MENPSIPFMGDNEVSNTTLPEQLAPWVDQWDRVPILLALSLYSTPRKELGPFRLFKATPRVAAWIDYKTNTVIIGSRGTAVGSTGGISDLKDDSVIASNSNYCNISIVQEATDLINTITSILNAPNKIASIVLNIPKTPDVPIYWIFAGHSLGGTSSLCLTSKYLPNARGISVNGGAAPTNPVMDGPGPQNFTHYHIVGDLISSHMSEQAGKVVRVKIPGKNFGSLSPHGTGNLLLAGNIVSADLEDEEYFKWGANSIEAYSVVSPLISVSKFMTYLQVRNIVRNNPIPGSSRSQ